MKCHYEVLGIERDADEKSIKNSYRKLALRYHPDKNPDNIDEAKAQFLLVQQAYDVLSDPHERAWYDNHREQILRGSQTDYEDDSLDVFPYFTAACYSGFGDDEEGFYGVYAHVFDQLATEDIEFMDSPDEYETIPKFGTSTSDYDSVVGPFYAYWQSYCTKKTYTWLCPHNLTEIRDRRILREVEKETKKLAQKAKKERNDEIRALVAFVRRRDKRVQEYKKLLEERAEMNRIKQQQHRLAQLKRNKLEAEAMHKQQQQQQSQAFCTNDHEEQLRQMDRAYGSDSEYSDEEDEINEDVDADADDTEDYVDELYCVACNKSFKNAQSYENHESSKKHRDNIERLRKEMQHDDDDDDVDSELENGVDEASHEDVDSNEEIKEIPPAKLSLGKKAKKTKNRKSMVAQHVHEAPDDDEIDDIEKPLGEIAIGNISDSDDWHGDSGGKKGKKSKQKKSKPSKVGLGTETITTTIDAETASTSEAIAPEKSKKKSKKEEKAPVKADVADTDHICVTCHSLFDSKNKLFTHLKKTNHGVYIPKASTAGAAPAAAEKTKRGKKK